MDTTGQKPTKQQVKDLQHKNPYQMDDVTLLFWSEKLKNERHVSDLAYSMWARIQTEINKRGIK